VARLETRSVRDLLGLAKHYSSIAVDLALYSLASGSKIAALEALKIEDQLDRIVKDLVAAVSLAVRSPDDAGLAIVVDEIARGFDKVTDAAGDMAGLVIRGYPIHPYVRAAVNCCGDAVMLARAARKIDRLPGLVDILLVKRGDAYILAPEDRSIEEGDLVVIRGTPEEVAEAAATISGEHGDPLEEARVALDAARAGDELAEKLIRLRWLARGMLDLALHALIYADSSVAGFVEELEDSADQLYHEVLELSYAASVPGSAKEMAGLAVFAGALEYLADASVMLARTAAYKLDDDYLEVIGEALEEAEEGYVKLRVTSKASGFRLADLGLAELGVSVLALGRGGRWIAPVRPDYTLKEGDILLVKYYRPEGSASDETILVALEDKGLVPIDE